MIEKIKQLKKYPFLVIFALFVFGIFVLDMFATGKEFSEMENRYLKTRPDFSIKSLVNNEYTKKYESFINDQFVFRDGWISLKSISENALLKVENNGVAIGKDDYIFAKVTKANDALIKENINHINTFLDTYTGKFTLGIIPNSYAVLDDKFPLGYEHIIIDQQKAIDEISRQITGSNVEILDTIAIMGQGKSEDIYYHTDHHWTTDGAWLMYEAYTSQNNLAYTPLTDLQQYRNQVEGFYGTYFSKAKNFNSPGDTLVWYDIPVTSVTIDGKTTIKDSDDEDVVIDGLYWHDKFDTRDKYSAFLYGNNGHTVIKSDNNLNKTEEPSKILIIKDSYSNSLAPYFTYSYDEVHLVDLRAMATPLSQLMEQEQYDEILMLYNYDTFENERSILKVKF